MSIRQPSYYSRSSAFQFTLHHKNNKNKTFSRIRKLYLSKTYRPRSNCSYPLSYLTRICPAFANSVDPDQLASSEANWSGSALFAIKYVNLYQQSGSSNLIGWKLEMGVAS